MSSFNPTPWLHFAVTAIDFELTPTGTKITITSDKPCHLWKKWKLKPPSRRKFWTIQRGIKTYCYPKYYLHKPYTREQQEPGDTLIHTFIQEPWATCVTHWFFFLGSVGGTPSASQTAIFHFHRTYAPPPIEHEKYISPLLKYVCASGDMANYQQFTPQDNYTITLIEEPLSRWLPNPEHYPDTWWVELRPTDQNGHPTNVILGQASVRVDTFPVYPNYSWFLFPMPSVPVLKDVKYAIVSYHTNWLHKFLYPYILADDPGGYPRGGYSYGDSPTGPWQDPSIYIDHGFKT